MSEFYKALYQISGQDVFLSISPDAADFTSQKPVTLIVRTKGLRLDIPLPCDQYKLGEMAGKLMMLSGPNNVVIGWNLKAFFSYMLGRTKKPFELNGNIFDLQILEWYVGIEKERPDGFLDAKQRLSAIVKHPSFSELKNVYDKIYTPLLTHIIPSIETLGIINRQLKKKVHSHYEIAGQINGRMKCTKAFQSGFNPHSMSEDERKVLGPPGFDQKIMYLDYKHMEVSVLQWLSGDDVLGGILDSGRDSYEEIWTMLTTLKCTPQFRDKCKAVFLPVVFGQGVASVAERTGMPETTAGKFVDKIYKTFPMAMGWVKRQQNVIVDGVGRDAFSRQRSFEPGEEYKIRNFVVQSPASLICLYKLVALEKELQGRAKIGFHIHDGYVLFIPKIEIKKIRESAVNVLEADSDIFPKLKLRVSCRIGDNLNDLIDF